MPRNARIVVPHAPHHVTQRGNNRQDVFFTDDDRRSYLATLRDRCQKTGVRVLGYCLMTNHVHLIVVPPREDALAAAIGRTHFLHAQRINHWHDRRGHLWQGRFHSTPMDDVHLWRALAYVERNPVRARLVRHAWRWPWSSAGVHCGAHTIHGARGKILDLAPWWAEWSPDRWRTQLIEPEDDAWRTRLHRAARTGRPLAEDAWLEKTEARLGRRLRANRVGRPRKDQ